MPTPRNVLQIGNLLTSLQSEPLEGMTRCMAHEVRNLWADGEPVQFSYASLGSNLQDLMACSVKDLPFAERQTIGFKAELKPGGICEGQATVESIVVHPFPPLFKCILRAAQPLVMSSTA